MSDRYLKAPSSNLRPAWRCLAAGLLALMVASSVAAADFYVAPNGDDAASGSLESPFGTIARATEAARPGDVIRVLPGVLREVVEIMASGEAGAPITIAPQIPGTVVIDGSETPEDTSLVQIYGDHLIFEGFHVYNARRSGIVAWGTTGVVIRGNQVTGSVRSGIWVGHHEPGQSRENLIEGNVVFSTSLVNKERDSERGWPVALHVSVSDETIVRGNEVFKNYGEGVGVLSSRGARIENNVVYDNFSVMIYLDNAPGSVVTGNTVATTGDERFFRRGRPGHGIVIANEWTQVELLSRGIRIENNSLLGVGPIFYGDYEAATGLHDSVVENNTVLEHRLDTSDWVRNRVGTQRRPRQDRRMLRRSIHTSAGPHGGLGGASRADGSPDRSNRPIRSFARARVLPGPRRPQAPCDGPE